VFDDEEVDSDIFNIGLSLNLHGFFFHNIEKLEELKNQGKSQNKLQER
jgi:hypothetical protein